MAGTLPALTTLAAANGALPRCSCWSAAWSSRSTSCPSGLQAVAELLPSTALAQVFHGALGGGTVPGSAFVVLVVWARGRPAGRRPLVPLGVSQRLTLGAVVSRWTVEGRRRCIAKRPLQIHAQRYPQTAPTAVSRWRLVARGSGLRRRPAARPTRPSWFKPGDAALLHVRRPGARVLRPHDLGVRHQHRRRGPAGHVVGRQPSASPPGRRARARTRSSTTRRLRQRRLPRTCRGASTTTRATPRTSGCDPKEMWAPSVGVRRHPLGLVPRRAGAGRQLLAALRPLLHLRRHADQPDGAVQGGVVQPDRVPDRPAPTRPAPSTPTCSSTRRRARRT